MSFGKWLVAAFVVTAGIAMLDQYNTSLALGAVIIILLALFFRYPRAWSEIESAFGLGSMLPPNERT